MSDGAEAFFSALLSIGVSQEIAGVVTESIRRTDAYGGRLQAHEAEITRLSGICDQVSRQVGLLADQMTDLEATVTRVDSQLADVQATQTQILLADPNAEVRQLQVSVQDLQARVTQVTSELAGLAQQTQQASAMPQPPMNPGVHSGQPSSTANASRPAFITDVRMVEKPAPFSGDKADAAALGAFFANVEQYFYVCGVTDPVQMGNIAVMWLRGNAQVWWRTIREATDLSTFTWDQLKAKMEVQFKPYDAERQARDQWAACVQGKDSVAGYIQRYRECLLRIRSPAPSEVLDRFTRNLAANVRGLVYLFAPTTFEEAALAAERVDASLRASGPVLPTSSASAAPSPQSGPVPMQLGAAGQAQRRPSPRSNTAPFACHFCGVQGHGWKNCNKLFGELSRARNQPSHGPGSSYPRPMGGRMPPFGRGGRSGRGGSSYAHAMEGSFPPTESAGTMGASAAVGGFATPNLFDGLPVFPAAPSGTGQSAGPSMPSSSVPGAGQ